jgi:hypothetical protein
VKYWFSGANWGDQLADVISSLMVYVIPNTGICLDCVAAVSQVQLA